MLDNMHDDAKECLKLYAKADSFAKRVSEFRQQVAIPSYNQLRYAGHHFMEAMASDSEDEYVERLREARSHCKRAMYDAAEGGLTSAIERVARFKEQYKDTSIVDVVRDIASIDLLMDEAIEAMIQNRTKEIPVEVSLAGHMELFDKAVSAVKLLDASRDELNKKQLKNLLDRRNFIIKTSLTVFGILITIVATVIGLLIRFGIL